MDFADVIVLLPKWLLAGFLPAAFVSAVSVVVMEQLREALEKKFKKEMEWETLCVRAAWLSAIIVICFLFYKETIWEQKRDEARQESYSEGYSAGVVAAVDYIHDNYSGYENAQLNESEEIEECENSEELENLAYALEDYVNWLANGMDEVLHHDGYQLAENLLESNNK